MATTRARTEVTKGTIDDVRAAHDLFVAHWREIALNQQLMKLDPNWRYYYELEERGQLLVMIVRYRGKVVGYSVTVLIESHPHYAGLCIAQNDVVYLDPSRRCSGAGARLVLATEEAARSWRAGLGKPGMMIWHGKDTDAGKPLLQLLARLEYKTQDIVVSKEL